MVSTHLRSLGALVPLIVLVQPAHAEEEAAEEYLAQFEIAMEALTTYVDVISDLQDEKLSPAEAAEAITEIAEQLASAKKTMLSLLPKLSKEEKEEINEAMEDEEMLEIFAELDEAVSTLREFLEKEYADEGLIDAAQRKFDAAYQ